MNPADLTKFAILTLAVFAGSGVVALVAYEICEAIACGVGFDAACRS